MGFRVITDPDKLRELGKAQLLWYYMRSKEAWHPSVNSPTSWGEWSHGELAVIAGRMQYAVLLED